MAETVLLFPHEPFAPGRCDPDFLMEYEAARAVGFRCLLYGHEELEEGRVGEALAGVRRRDEAVEGECSILLRGWMVPGEVYRDFHEGLCRRGYRPHTSPEAYEEAHYLPLAYPHLTDDTARSEWLMGDDEDAAWQMYAAGFASGEALIKDWVKSAKARWKEGCYIPAGCDEARFRSIYRVFREERGRLFNRGVVLREFMPLVGLGSDIDGYPLVMETRLFFCRQELVAPPEPCKPSPMEELGRWQAIARRFASPFMTIDVALLTDGRWKIVEVGDGGVSGLPVGVDPLRFYAALWNRLSGEEPVMEGEPR